jgi:hypothetical protein
MIEQNKLDVLCCFCCDKVFASGDVVYTISVNFFHGSSLFQEAIIFDTDMLLDVKRRIHFHEKCFSQVAGSKYMP